jgi:hypothetical protein
MAEPKDAIATDKEKFDVLYKSLADYSDKFVGRLLSVMGFQLVGLGWVITSEPARKFFANSEVGAIGTIIISLALALSFVPSIYRVWNSHKHALRLLLQLNYMSEEFYQQHVLPNWYLPVAIAIVLVLYLACAVLIAHWQWTIL